MKRHHLLPLALCAVALIAAASASATGQAPFKAALVVDVGGFNDHGFNQLQLAGIKQASKTLHIPYQALSSHSSSDYIPNLVSVARSKDNIIIAGGFELDTALLAVAKQFPTEKFAITDTSVTAAPFNGKLKNVEGLTYAAQQGSYLAGCLAALMTKKHGGPQNISVVGGVPIPPVVAYVAGYQAGAQHCDPGIKVQIGYSQDFVAQDKCEAIALNQIGLGSQVVFVAAGPCGLGALIAAKQKGVWGIGVDKDQSSLGPHILTSAIKRVNVGVADAIRAAYSGHGFKPGGNLVFDLKSGGVGLGKISPKVPASFIRKINQLKEQIIAGKINVPTTVHHQ